MSNTVMGGFRWLRNRDGGTKCPVEIHGVADDYATAIFKGDPVKLVADGTMEIAAEGDTDVFGICDGVEQYWDGTVIKRGNYLPAATSYDTNLSRRSLLRVIPARGQVFEVDTDDSGSTYDTESEFLAFVGENVDHQAASGSTATGRSGYTVDISTHTNATAQWRILGISKRVDQDFSSSNVKIEVELNEGGQPTFTTSGI